jgi:hypothetical protein
VPKKRNNHAALFLKIRLVGWSENRPTSYVMKKGKILAVPRELFLGSCTFSELLFSKQKLNAANNLVCEEN